MIADTVGALDLCVALSWVSDDAIDRDVVVIALRLSGEGSVGTESDFIFYNAPKCADGSVRMAGCRFVNGRCVDELSVDLAAQPSDIATILIAAAVTSATFRDVAGLELTMWADDVLDPAVRVDLTGALSERAYVAGEFYRRNNQWKSVRSGRAGTPDSPGWLQTTASTSIPCRQHPRRIRPMRVRIHDGTIRLAYTRPRDHLRWLSHTEPDT